MPVGPLAMAEVRVRLPLGAFDIGAWGSLETRVLREHEIGGSNPTTLTHAVVELDSRFAASGIPHEGRSTTAARSSSGVGV